MKSTVRTLLFLSLCMGLGSCTDDMITESPEPLDNGSDGFLKEIIVNAPDPILQDEGANTRNQLYIEDGKLKTAWIEGDTLGIFPDTGAQVEFPIGGSGSSATFDGGGWALKNSYKYAAYYPFSKANYYTNSGYIVTDYRGQVQPYNNAMDHLGAYDFQASKQKATPKNGSVTITMGRLSAVLMFEITVPETDTYTELDLYNDEFPYSFRGQLNLSENTPIYNQYGWSSFVSLGLNNIQVDKGGKLMAYMMAFPTGNTMSHKLVLHGKNGVYEATLAAKEMKGTKKWVVEEMTPYYIKNKWLIQAAEDNTHNPGVTFVKENGYVNVNDATNREMLKNVKKIYVGNREDPHVMDDIGFFPNLEELGCWNNSLTHLDITKNPKLTYLNCEKNPIMCLDLSKNKELKTLTCSECRIADLDVSHNPALEKLTCNTMGGWLGSLDVTHNPALTYLDCKNNNIQNLDLYYNKNLVYLYCSDNILTSLDASRCAALNTIQCQNNYIESLNVSGCTALEYLFCNDNYYLRSLDLSTNTILKQLKCQNNNLNYLSVSKNKLLTALYCGSNPFESLYIDSSDLSKLTYLDVSNSPNLKYLDCAGYIGSGYSTSTGALKTLVLTGCTELKELDVMGNKLESLDVSPYTKMTFLRCPGNLLTSLNVSSNTKLTYLSCYANLMSSLNISNCTQLTLDNLACGAQWTNSNKNTEQTLYLTKGSSNTGALAGTTTYNKNVQ